jgi:hypothetical protein
MPPIERAAVVNPTREVGTSIVRDRGTALRLAEVATEEVWIVPFVPPVIPARSGI